MSKIIGYVINARSAINHRTLNLGAGETLRKAYGDAYGEHDLLRYARPSDKTKYNISDKTIYAKVREMHCNVEEVTEDDEGTNLYDFCVRTIEENIEATAQQDSLNQANS